MKVFISSTTSGLGSYRQFASDFLKEWYNVDPIWEGCFTADQESAMIYLGDLITSCDRVICLVGPYCGSCPSDQPPDQRRSYTQIEYDIANRSGLPVHILDGRQCQLDPAPQSQDELQLQEEFWEEIERQDPRLRPVFHDKAHLSRLLLRLIKNWEGRADSLRNLPTPFFQWHRRLQMQDRAAALASFGEILDFVVCLAAAEVGHPDPLPITEVDDLMERASQNGFITELKYLEFVEYLKWYQAVPKRVPPLLKDITSRYETTMQLLRILDVYLLVNVQRHDRGVRLRVYRGPTPTWENDLELCEDIASTYCQEELYLLDTRRRKSLRLSPYLQLLPEEPDFLGVWWRESPEQPVQLLPFANLHDPVRAPNQKPSLTSQTALLAIQSWCILAEHHPPGDRQVGEYCGDWRIIGAAIKTRNLVKMFLATRDGPDLPAGLWRAKGGLDETTRRHIGEQFQRWYDYARLEPELVGRVLHFEPGERPAIVTAIPADMRPLSKILAPGAPPLDPNAQPLHQLVCGVVKICRFLASHRVRLIHCSPADLYWDGKKQCQLVGVGNTLADGECLPRDSALWDILGGDELPIVAPELVSGARTSIASEMFAIGVMLQRCRRQTPPMPLPVGDENDVQDANMRARWRNDPLDCFVFHCLARQPHRRFISWENFLSYFEICTAPNAMARLTMPEMITLHGGLRISRCQVTNFQYERFCHSRRQVAPAQSLPWNYTTPFAPVVGVSVDDCEVYCVWLGEQYGGRWRLPTAKEWMAAAGTESFPWGSEAPNPTLANYYGACRGPTIAGAYPDRDHGNGLRDMAGNVWEWCRDQTPEGPWRLLKGGSFASPGSDLQVKIEDYRIAGGRYIDVGFRVVQEGGN